MFVGSLYGVLLNVLLPEFIIMVLFCIVMGYVLKESLKLAKEITQKELKVKESNELPLLLN